ncbi:MAG: homocysteine S-methyltransferase family protein, partial [Clostridiales bacterium]|nr:homocysteine S-methyltransferase family protein [Clostridiales bacterium]
MREKILLCDGSFGTYFESKHPDFGGAVECANLEGAGLVRAVHAEYLESGARMLRTNTFGANEPALRCGREGVNGILRAGYAAARALADERPDGPVFVATSIGPVFSDGADLEYRLIAREFLDAGAEVVLFETLSEYDAVLPLLKELKATGARGGRGPFVILSFCVNRYGYTDTGISAKRIVQTLSDVDEVDCIGFNCGTGPLHLYRVLSALDLAVPKFLMVLPNAGYPEIANNRFSYQQNIPYFTEWVARIRELGVNIIGGCCGTTPQYTRMLREKIPESPVARAKKRRAAATASQSNSAPAAQTRGPASPSPSPVFGEKLRARQKILAVELDPPLNANYTKLMEDAIRLKNQGVDILTFADSPTGRARADSFLIASKVV